MTTQQLASKSLYNVFLEESSARVLALKWLHTFYVADDSYVISAKGFGWWVNKMLGSENYQFW